MPIYTWANKQGNGFLEGFKVGLTIDSVYSKCIKDAVIDSPERPQLPQANILTTRKLVCYATNTCTCSAIIIGCSKGSPVVVSCYYGYMGWGRVFTWM